MEQYIPKSVLVAEIEKLRKKNDDYNKPSHIADVCYKEFLSLIDTIEVKEVDLEKELDSMITPELKFHKALPSLFDVAKHFFELGLNISKG